MNIIERSYLQGNVMIYFDREDTSSFQYVKALCVNDDLSAFLMISPDGEYDGVIALTNDRIYRVDTGGQYEEKMRKLCSGLDRDAKIKNKIKIDPENIYRSLLVASLDNKEVVSIELCESSADDIVGIVEDIDDDGFKVKLIDEYGKEDGYAYAFISDISKIVLSSCYERRIGKLFKLQKK